MPTAMTHHPVKGCRLSAPAIVCSLGHRNEQITAALLSGQRGLTRNSHWLAGKTLSLGEVDYPLPDLSDMPESFRSRNNQLLEMALQQLQPAVDAFKRQQPQARIGVVLGTSTSGIAETEQVIGERVQTGQWPAGFQYARQEIGAPAEYAALRLGAKGPVYTLSTACTSSARALASARRLLRAGLCDAVIAGGVDSLCSLTVHGFAALEALSPAPCQPFAATRKGINLGEAAALFLVTPESGGIQLSGVGESSDAHHISAPHPEGRGALSAMQAALKMANRAANEVGYVNLHGTATLQNDRMEARVVNQLFGADIPCSSTKALTGHTLGACGALEAAFCWLGLAAGERLPHTLDVPVDPDLAPIHLARSGRLETPVILSNAFAFGGNNVALLLEGEA
ncbi:beta-ketoacyl-ACP synthase [Halopseudomonas salegens]|uniref:3-oxoacyl-[acyl-carrier-protein] synthase-1 n=1 Tax=Halopseudomonas salegens TaxID=1434072 RepID=A0A1H2GWK5_9GAMM|nr:beta-ketoacyl-ACP synthase [Halopseudomonas salegens]SDU24027.1 3-oxoacyl-[acyl-carrier-protein] synthase-1 [Halopseudomonas salegens]